MVVTIFHALLQKCWITSQVSFLSALRGPIWPASWSSLPTTAWSRTLRTSQCVWWSRREQQTWAFPPAPPTPPLLRSTTMIVSALSVTTVSHRCTLCHHCVTPMYLVSPLCHTDVPCVTTVSHQCTLCHTDVPCVSTVSHQCTTVSHQ